MRSKSRIRSLIAPLRAVPLLSLLALAPVSAADKPVKVYILAGQSNMVGIGQVDGGSVRIADEVSDPAKHPDFAGTVKSVDTRPFYRAPEVSPRNQSFHYHGNAETYMLVGEAMGKAMVEMQKK